MINLRTEILKALPIPDFFMWWWNNWPGFGFHVWADELLEMEKEGIVKIERGGKGGVGQITVSITARFNGGYTLLCKRSGLLITNFN